MLGEGEQALDQLVVAALAQAGLGELRDGNGTHRSAPGRGAHLRSDGDGAAPPFVRGCPGGGVGVEEPVVGVIGEPHLRTVDRQPVSVGCVAYAMRERPVLGPPPVEQVERELNRLKPELVAGELGPLCRLGPALDRKTEVDTQAHSRLVCRARMSSGLCPSRLRRRSKTTSKKSS